MEDVGDKHPSFRLKKAELRSVRHTLRQLHRKAKREYRTYWGRVLEKCPAKGKLAAARLQTDGDLSEEQRDDVAPDILGEHFNKLFGKTSAASEVDPLGPPEKTAWHLSGPPTLSEVTKAIKDLGSGKATGADCLPAEVFKAGAESLAVKFTKDLGEIWPETESWSGSEHRGDIKERVQPATDTEYSACNASVEQSWQDAVLIALFKNKGSPTDPGNYRGIFLLEIAGKILASVLNSRIQALSSGWLSDTQCGFRPRRGAAMQILAIRRLQQALREVDGEAAILFIDFAKAFDSPPRSALWRSLRHIGCPPDLLAVIEAIHLEPRATIQGYKEPIKMERGIRQGCMLGPTLFIILLDVILQKSGCTDALGIDFVCSSRGPVKCPVDIEGQEFSAETGEYADDCWFLAKTPGALTEALHRLQETAGSLGLDVSVGKTEWLWLSKSNQRRRTDMIEAGVQPQQQMTISGMSEEEISRVVHLNGRICRKVTEFSYLGSLITEEASMSREIEVRCWKAMKALNALNPIMENKSISRRFKARRIMSHVVPVLLYGSETWNTVDRDMSTLEVFLNKCRQRVLGRSRLNPDGTVLTNAELHESVKLQRAHVMVATRRLAFAAKVVGEGECKLARKAFFAQVPQKRRIPARMQGDYRKRLIVDELNLKGPGPGPGAAPGELFKNLVEVQRNSCDLSKSAKAQKVKGLLLNSRQLVKMDGNHQRALLVHTRTKELVCPERDCLFRCAENKELLRHGRVNHSPGEGRVVVGTSASDARSARENAADPAVESVPQRTVTYSGAGPPYICGIGSCIREYKQKGGFLQRHIKMVHGLIAVFEPIQQSTHEDGGGTDLAGGAAEMSAQSAENSAVSDGIADEGPLGDLAAAQTTGQTPGLGPGQRPLSLGSANPDGSITAWSPLCVPTRCPFKSCGYPIDGKPKLWKTWRNHCALTHSWNLQSGKASRSRAGKNATNSADSARTAGQPVRSETGKQRTSRDSGSTTQTRTVVVSSATTNSAYVTPIVMGVNPNTLGMSGRVTRVRESGRASSPGRGNPT
jgi:hypothetical protein